MLALTVLALTLLACHRIGTNTPSPLAIAENANVLARLVITVIILVIISNTISTLLIYMSLISGL